MTGFGVDLKNIDFAEVVGARSPCAGDINKVHSQRGAGGQEAGRYEAGRGDQQQLARFVELHAHLSSTGRNHRPLKTRFGIESQRAHWRSAWHPATFFEASPEPEAGATRGCRQAHVVLRVADLAQRAAPA